MLVRCDGIEHLIMVGGPADVVVENDVKKVRGPGAGAGEDADQRLRCAEHGAHAVETHRAASA